MGRYGLLGKKLGHSFSPILHKTFGGYDYELFERREEELEDFLKKDSFSAINVTIPYKKVVIPYLSELSDIAKRTQSVNVIVRREDGSLFGDNSDYFGLQYAMERKGISLSGKKVLLLGDGGVAAMVRVLAADMGAASCITISRRGEDNYENLARHYDAEVIINTTPVGMYPNNGEAVISLKPFTKCTCVTDLIFNPLRTAILQEAEQYQMITLNGLDMLTAQAARACERFLGCEIPKERIAAVCDEMLHRVENIVLVGMPGCGKSSIAHELAKVSGRTLIDTDEEITLRYGRQPGQIITKDGEEAFRALETEVLADVSKQTGVIISCGGGVVTKKENYPLLHQNGRIFYIQRALDQLATEGRPLSQGSLGALFEKRRACYEAFADEIIDNNTELCAAVAQIRERGGI